jgi:hypothetical protein
MLIREVDKSFLPRTRAKGRVRETSPLREAAEGLGVFLGQLSETIRESRRDSLDSGLGAHGRSPLRNFKWPTPQGEGEEIGTVNLNLTEDQSEALNMLRDARGVASDAITPNMPRHERMASQERLQTLFTEISAKRIEILSSMLDRTTDNGLPLFNLFTPESSQTAYTGIEEIIMRFLETETRGDAVVGTDTATGTQQKHDAALNAAEQLKDFLLSEGPAKAFSRFREINRSNVLGLLQ